MASSSNPRFSNWFRTFATTLLPNKDGMEIGENFFAYWGDTLDPGLTHCTDPNGNILQLQLSLRSHKAKFYSGVMKMATFYGLNAAHTVILHYKGENLFHMRIFSMDFEEIRYPGVPGPSDSVPNHNFFRTFKTTLHPSKDVMEMGDAFNFFCNDQLCEGRSCLTDPEGNLHFLQISQNRDGVAFFSAGVTKMAQFYQLNTVHECWLHWIGENKFEMKIVTNDNTEIDYPLVIEISGQSTQVVSHNNEADQELEDDVQQEVGKSWERVVSKSVAGGGQTLAIPTRYVDTVVSAEQGHIYVQLEGGSRYECILKSSARRQKEVYLTTGWYQFLKENKICEGDVLFFWFLNDPYVLYVRIIKKQKKNV